MDIVPIIARIQSQCPLLRSVGGAAEFTDASLALKHQLPAAFVLPLSDDPQPNRLDNGISQRVNRRFGVVLAVKNLRDASGAAALSDLVPLRSQLIDALLGWVPDGLTDPCEYAAGRLLELSQQVLWWQDDFLTAFYLRKV